MSRLVLLARKLDQGGAERQIVTLAKALQKRGHDVHVVLFYNGGVLDRELAVAGVRAHFVGKRGRWDTFGFLVRLAQILRSLRPAAVYSYLDLPNILAALLRPVIGRPRLIWSIRAAGMEMRHYDWLSRIIPRLEAGLSQAADVIVANSHAGAEWAVNRGFPAGRITVIENGIDTVRFRPDPKDRDEIRNAWRVSPGQRLIGIVARLDVMKDHPNFLRACALLVARRSDLRFICVGGGVPTYLAELKSLAECLGIAAQMIWLGARQDMQAVYCSLDIICSSSAFGEGFSNVIGEAMACGVPCVVTDVGDSARIVGELGEIVPPRNSEALADGISRMLERIEKPSELGRQNRDRIQDNFSIDRMVLRTEKVIFSKL